VDAGDRLWLEQATRIIETLPPEERPDWHAISQRMGVGYEAFRKRFALLSGTPPARFRTRRQIERACELIGRGGMPIREVAERVGFSNEFHFSRRFKEMTGYSPTEFRRKMPG